MPANAPPAAGFSVFTTAIDRRGVKNIDLLINGWKWTETPGVFGKTSPYVLNIPNEVPDGVMDIDVRACNDIDVCATARVTVTRGAACAGPANCLASELRGRQVLLERALRRHRRPPAPTRSSAQRPVRRHRRRRADLHRELLRRQRSVPRGLRVQLRHRPAGSVRACGRRQAAAVARPAARRQRGLLLNLGLGALVGVLAIRRRRRRA
jgi:hypothetical protein